jgi:hypothetical protein
VIRENKKSRGNGCYQIIIIKTQSNFSRNYELMLNYLYLKTRYSRRQHLDALFPGNVFKNKINFCSIMDTVGLHIHVLTKQIRDFSTFRVKIVSRLSPSTRCVLVIAANSICRSIDIFNKNSISLKDTFSMRSGCQIDSFIISYLNSDFMYTFGTCLHMPLVCVCCFCTLSLCCPLFLLYVSVLTL